MRKPSVLRPGDRIAIVAPASPFNRDEFHAGVREIEALGFHAVYEDDVFARHGYVAGPAGLRARAWQAAWQDDSVRAIVAARGGYGSVQILPLLDAAAARKCAKAFIGYSDNTSLLTWLMQEVGTVAFHGPMVEGRFAKGEAGYDRDTFLRCLCRVEPAGEITHPALEVLRRGEAIGTLVGGTLTQLAASLGTPFAFDPPPDCVLFLDEVGERPYRVDRMLTQLRLAGVLRRASAVIFGELPRCDEPPAGPTARDAALAALEGFSGPVLFGLPSGHTTGPTLTLPLGVQARVVAGVRPHFVVEEAAVTDR